MGFVVRSTVQGPTVGEAKRVGSKKRRPSGTVKEKATAGRLAKTNLKFKKNEMPNLCLEKAW